MTDVLAAERELSEFLNNAKNQALRTWDRRRTTEEMNSLVLRRLAELDDIIL